MSTRSRPAGLAAATLVTVAVYLALAGPDVLLHPGRTVFGRNPSNDVQIMAWSLRYWPWAIAHGAAPWHTSLLWAPTGFSTLWLTSIPGPALAALPITLTAGPLVAFNVLMLLAAVLASAAAYLLCWEVTENAPASALGALLFGLSPYLLGHAMSQHLNLVFVFPLPLLALACVRYARRKTTTRRFVATFTALLLLLASASLELFVDTTLVLAIVAAVSLAAGERARGVVRLLGLRVAGAFALCALVLAPIAVAGLATPHAPVQYLPADFSTDLVNIVLPTPTALLGSVGWIAHASSLFVGNIGERDGYLGVPVLLVCIAALRREWRRLWPAGLVLAAAVLLSLGPVVAFAGRPLVSLPLALTDVPVAADALPARFAVFASLAAAVLVAAWLARRGRLWPRAVAAVSIAAFMLPNFWPSGSLPHAWATSTEFAWSTPHLPAGFTAAATWRRVVPRGANVLVLPTGNRTAAQWWQVRTGMAFALAAPETPFVPPGLGTDPTVVQLVDDVLPQLNGTALAAARLRAVLRQRRVDVVDVTPGARRLWLPVVRRATDTRAVRFNGAFLFRVPARARPLAALRQVGRGRLRVWLAFDGRRGRLLVRDGQSRTVMLSHADAEAASATRGAVAFVEWNGRRDLLRVATRAGSRWQLATLDRSGAPIWSQRVAATPDGTVVTGWVDEAGRDRRLLVAARPPHGRWTPPVALDVGEGLGSFTFIHRRGGLAVGWSDVVASEWRVLVSRFESGHWTKAAAIATSVGRLDRNALFRAVGNGRALR